MSFRVREWFKQGKLMFVVRGEPPKIIVNREAIAAEERARREQKMKATGGLSRTKTAANQVTLLEAEKEDLEEEVQHFKQELKQRDAELANLKRQLASNSGRPAAAASAPVASGDSNAQLEQLTRELAAARKEAADHKKALDIEKAKPQKSSSCSMM